MSNRPGIGTKWFQKYYKDVYPDDKIINKKGKASPPPRFYDKLIEKQNPKLFKKVQIERRKRLDQLDPHELTYERQEVKEKIKISQTKQLTREYEETS